MKNNNGNETVYSRVYEDKQLVKENRVSTALPGSQPLPQQRSDAPAQPSILKIGEATTVYSRISSTASKTPSHARYHSGTQRFLWKT